jgi:hypothetical protein
MIQEDCCGSSENREPMFRSNKQLCDSMNNAVEGEGNE